MDVVDDEGYAPLHLAVEAPDGPEFAIAKLLLQVLFRSCLRNKNERIYTGFEVCTKAINKS